VGLGNIDFSLVVNVKFSPGSWVELSHELLHLGLGNLLGNEKDLSASLLAVFFVEDLGASELSGSILDGGGVVVEDVVVDIVFVGTEVLGGWSISCGWGWILLLLLLLEENGLSLLNLGEGHKGSND